MSVEQVINTALAEEGYLEKASNSNLDSKTGNAGDANYTKYWRDLCSGLQKQPWCNCFVNWCFVKTYDVTKAKELLCTSGDWSYYTPTSAQYFKNNKQWYTNSPKEGDIIYFKNSQRIHHVGIVYKVDSTKVYTIEGNTSAGTQVIPNGGGVFKKSYALNNPAIAGYGRPGYGAAPAPKVETVKVDSIKSKLKVTVECNIRSNPNKQAAIVGSYKEGTEILPIERSRKVEGIYWFKTDKGWISGKCVSGWIKDNGNSWWYNKNGDYYKNCWQEIDGETYYFLKDGYTASDIWIKSNKNDVYLYVNEKGLLIKDKKPLIKPRDYIVEGES